MRTMFGCREGGAMVRRPAENNSDDVAAGNWVQ